MPTFTKDPDEVLDYQIDWEERLTEDDLIATSDWDVPIGIIEDSSSNTTTTATIWLSGGYAGEQYRLVNRIVTVGGRTLEEAINITVVASTYSVVSVEEVKKRLRIDTDDDDSVLEGYISAASKAVEAYLKYEFESPIDSRIITAIIILVGYWYREPDGDSDKAFEMGYLPKPVMSILYPMRDPAFG